MWTLGWWSCRYREAEETWGSRVLEVDGRVKQGTLVWVAYSFHFFKFFDGKIIVLQSYVCFYCATPVRHVYIHTAPPSGGFPGGANAGDTRDTGSIPGLERCLVEGMETHSGTLARRIPWTEEPGGPRSVGSQSQRWLKRLHAGTCPSLWRLCPPCRYTHLLFTASLGSLCYMVASH